MGNLLKNKAFTTCILCLFAFIAHAQYDSLFNIPYPQRYETANVIVRYGMDSVNDFRIADELLTTARKRNNEQDLLCVEQAVLSIDNLWKVDVANFEQRANALIVRARDINCNAIITYIYIRLGDHYYSNMHNYTLAFEYYLKAYNNYHNLYKDEMPDMSQAQYELALAYYKLYDYRNSLKYCVELATKKFGGYEWLSIFSNDLAGMSYLKLQQYDSAMVYFNKTLKLAPTHHYANEATAWKGIATGNIGTILYLQHEYEKAIPYLLKGEELSTQGGVMDNTASFAVYLSNIYLAQHNSDAAQKQLQIAMDATHRSNDLQNYCQLYTALSAFYRQAGNTTLTLQYQDSSLRFKDSLAVITDVSKKYGVEMAMADERRGLNEKLVKKEEQKQLLLRNGLIIFSLMALLSVLLFFNRKLLKQKLQRDQLMADKLLVEKEMLITEADLYNTVRQLDGFKNNIAEKNDLIASLEKEISGNGDTAVLIKLQQSTILTDGQWDSFRQLFEKAHPGFLQKLREKLPDLTPAEVRFLVLLKLNFTNKEMAAALGVGPDAIRVTWYRIRKKLNLPEEGNIEELVRNI